MKPKTWRIFTFADDNWYHHHGCWYHQLPLTRLISEPATIFTPPWFFQNNFRCFLFFARFSVNTCCFWYFRFFFDLWLLCQRCERRFLCYSRLLKTTVKLSKPQETLGDLYLKQSSSCQEYTSVVDVFILLYSVLFHIKSVTIATISMRKYSHPKTSAFLVY